MRCGVGRILLVQPIATGEIAHERLAQLQRPHPARTFPLHGELVRHHPLLMGIELGVWDDCLTIDQMSNTGLSLDDVQLLMGQIPFITDTTRGMEPSGE